ncbi:triacylglycerol lipase 2-like protein [Senna tora]|uniref:Triacylglycerol lipase 2-like protein n=1 Tax=Senna tora TaxID=362788 RepID=A0A834T6G3_9FABA|nr:triacylglycerol lipase 2-like protein [Senna tora]
MQRFRRSGTSILGSLSAPNLRRKAQNSWAAMQDTFFSTKDTFERHRVVFTVGTSIASVATAWIGYSLRHLHDSKVDQRLESIERAGSQPVLVVPPPSGLASLDVVDRTAAVGHCRRRVSCRELLRGALDGVSGHPRRSCSSVHGGSLSTVAGTGLVDLWMSAGYSLLWSVWVGVLGSVGDAVRLYLGWEDHKGGSDGERRKNIQADHGARTKEQGNGSTFTKVLRIFVDDGGTRRVQWVLRRHEEDKASKKSIVARPLTVARQVKHDGRLVCWVPRVQTHDRQDPSTQRTVVQRTPVRREVGVQTEDIEMVTLDVGNGGMETKVGEEGKPNTALCKGKAKMEAQMTTNVVIKDPSTSGVVKHRESHTDSSEADEGEFFDEDSIISFFDDEEGLLIEQLEKEYEEQEGDKMMRLDDALEGVASLLGMDVSENNTNVNSRGILTMPDMKNNYDLEHTEIRKIVGTGGCSIPACVATAGTTLIIGYGLGWRSGSWYANKRFRKEQMKMLGQIKPRRWQLLPGQIKARARGWQFQFLRRPLTSSKVPETAVAETSETKL